MEAVNWFTRAVQVRPQLGFLADVLRFADLYLGSVPPLTVGQLPERVQRTRQQWQSHVTKVCEPVCLLQGPVAIAAAVVAPRVQAAQYLEPTNPQRSYGAGVVTQGGRIVWLAGMGGTRAPDGKKQGTAA